MLDPGVVAAEPSLTFMETSNMKILTLIRAVPGVGPYLPYILLLPLGLGACSGAGSSPAADVAALESGLTAAESAATAYITLPLCVPATATATAGGSNPAGSNFVLCSKASITAQIKTADAQAYALVKAAEAAAGNPTSVATAQAAVAALLTLVPAPVQPTPVQPTPVQPTPVQQGT